MVAPTPAPRAASEIPPPSAPSVVPTLLLSALIASPASAVMAKIARERRALRMLALVKPNALIPPNAARTLNSAALMACSTARAASALAVMPLAGVRMAFALSTAARPR